MTQFELEVGDALRSLASIVHQERRVVKDGSELNRFEKKMNEDITATFAVLIHKLVVIDGLAASSQNWQLTIEIIQTLSHCNRCCGVALSSAISIIAGLFYDLNPDIDRRTFAKAYYDRFLADSE